MDIKSFVNSDWGHNGENLLHSAVRTNNIRLVDAVLKFGVDINHLDNSNETALFDCFNNKIFEVLLDAGINPNTQSKKGNTALFFLRDLDAFNLLLNARIKLNVNITNNSNENALIHYCRNIRKPFRNDHIEIIRRLIGMTNLDHNNGEVLRVLLQNKVTDLDFIDSIVSRLCSLNYVNSEGDSYLHYAARTSDNLEVINYLMRRGVNMDIENKKGEDFYDLCYKNVQKIIKLDFPEFMKFKELRNTASVKSSII